MRKNIVLMLLIIMFAACSTTPKQSIDKKGIRKNADGMHRKLEKEIKD